MMMKKIFTGNGIKQRYRSGRVLLVCLLTFNLAFFPVVGYSQTIPRLPAPGTMVNLTPPFVPALIKGVTIDPQNPLQFDFIIDIGDTGIQGEALAKESQRLVKYFLVALTVPEDDLWVNLSPYEKDRIIPSEFGQTEMGRDLLAQDYMLKQLTSSLMFPEGDLGKKFWERIYAKARALYGTTDIPLDTFNKIWILPDKATVFERDQSAFVVESHLKVMMEEDFSKAKNSVVRGKWSVVSKKGDSKQQLTSYHLALTSEVIREVLLPEIEREVNSGKIFANLRQIYNSLLGKPLV